jgi:hypothetical protein
MNRSAIRTIICLIVLLAVSPLSGFTDTESGQQKILTAEIPLYLEEHLDAARIVGSKIPDVVPEPVEWRFDEPQPDWKPLKPRRAQMEAVKPIRVEDALRLPLTAKNRVPGSLFLFGRIYVELPDWNIEDWAYVEIRARTRDRMGLLPLGFNYTEEDQSGNFPLYSGTDWRVRIPVVADGTIQTYRFSLDWTNIQRKWQGPWTHLSIGCISNELGAALDILSVRVVSKEALYVDAPVGVRYEVRDNMRWRTIFTHTPGKLQYRLHTPHAGRLDVGLGVLREEVPVTFTVTATPDGGDTVTILEETYSDHKHWAQRRVDLSDFSRKKITISLEANADRAGTVAFWAEPTVSGITGMERLRTGTLIWDTQSPFVDEVDLRDKVNWQRVVHPTLGTRQIFQNYGRRYFFKGDAVVENEHLVAVFWSEKSRVVIYSKADLSQKQVVLVPLQLKQGSASIVDCRVLQNTGDDAALEVSFSGAETEKRLSAIFSFSKKEIVEITPVENMEGISLFSPIEYGIAPDFIADDLIFNPKKYPSTNTLHIPSDNLFLGLLKGQNSMLVVTWPEGEQQMKLLLADNQEKPRLIESVDFEMDGKSIYLALLEAPGIWHKEELKPSYLERDITINWKRPFPAKWITQLLEAGVIRTTYRFRGFRTVVWRAVVDGRCIYPVWFEEENTFYHLSKKIPPRGESLVYFLERRGTPVSVSAPVDIMKETLGGQVCGTILDLPGRVLRTYHRRPGLDHDGVCELVERVLEPLFEKGQEVEKNELVEETVDDLVFYVTRERERINEYQEFVHDLIDFVNLKRKSNPDLKPFLGSMETIIQEILQEYSRAKENMKTLDYVAELARMSKALAQKKDPNNLRTMEGLGEKWTGIGSAQDSLVVTLHSVTRNLFQEAGYGCVNQPEAIKIAKEIRSRCRKCLRNPYDFEIWPDY